MGLCLFCENAALLINAAGNERAGETNTGDAGDGVTR
jgi:hypothetical protein